jgi:metal-sulfur cluster biosynthetic enzyme
MAGGSAMPPISREQILGALREVVDPEIGINIVDLGLVYEIEVKDRDVRVRMTMTSPACPLSSYLEQSAEEAIRARVSEVGAVTITTVWEPVWDPSMMSPDARREMGWED